MHNAVALHFPCPERVYYLSGLTLLLIFLQSSLQVMNPLLESQLMILTAKLKLCHSHVPALLALSVQLRSFYLNPKQVPMLNRAVGDIFCRCFFKHSACKDKNTHFNKVGEKGH